MGRGHLIFGSFVRATYGVLALALPKVLLGGIPGVSEESVGAEGRYFNRLFGGRDLLIALVTLSQVRHGAERAALRTNVFCEVTDSISLVEEVRARRRLDTVTAVGLIFNVVGYRTWFKAASGLRRARKAGALESAAGDSPD